MLCIENDTLKQPMVIDMFATGLSITSNSDTLGNYTGQKDLSVAAMQTLNDFCILPKVHVGKSDQCCILQKN